MLVLLILPLLMSQYLTFMEMNFKTYGLTKINDDYFLTVAGSVGGIINGISKICAGFLIDRCRSKKIIIGFLCL